MTLLFISTRSTSRSAFGCS